MIFASAQFFNIAEAESEFLKISKFSVDELPKGDFLSFASGGDFFTYRVKICDSSDDHCRKVESRSSRIFLPPVSDGKLILDISVCESEGSPCTSYHYQYMKLLQRSQEETKRLEDKALLIATKNYHTKIIMNSFYYLLTRDVTDQNCQFNGLWHELTIRGKRQILSTIKPGILNEGFALSGYISSYENLEQMVDHLSLFSNERREKTLEIFSSEANVAQKYSVTTIPGFTSVDLGVILANGREQQEESDSLGLAWNPFKKIANSFRAMSSGKKLVKSFKQLKKTANQKFAPLKSVNDQPPKALFEKLDKGRDAVEQIHKIVREISDDSITNIKNIKEASAKIKMKYDLNLLQYMKEIKKQFSILLSDSGDMQGALREIEKYLGDEDFKRINSEFSKLMTSEMEQLFKKLPEDVSAMLGDPVKHHKKLEKIASEFTMKDLESIGELSRGMQRLRGLVMESAGVSRFSEAPASLRNFFRNLQIADIDHLKHKISALDGIQNEMGALERQINEMAQRHKNLPAVKRIIEGWDQLAEFMRDPEIVRFRQNISNTFTFVNSQNLESSKGVGGHIRKMMEKAGLIKSRFYKGWYADAYGSLTKLEAADELIASRNYWPEGDIRLEMEQVRREMQFLKNEIFTLHHLETFKIELPDGDLEILRNQKKQDITDVLQRFRSTYGYILNISGISAVEDFKKQLSNVEKVMKKIGLMEKKPVGTMSMLNGKIERFNQMMRQLTVGMTQAEWETFRNNNQTLVQLLGFKQDQSLLDQTNVALRKYEDAMNSWPPKTLADKDKILAAFDEMSSYKNSSNKLFWDKMYAVIANDPSQRGLLDSILKWGVEKKTGISDGETLQRYLFGSDPDSGKPSLLSKWLEREQKVQVEIQRLLSEGLSDPDPKITKQMAYAELWPKNPKKAEARLSRLSGLFQTIFGSDMVTGYTGAKVASVGDIYVGRLYRQFAPDSLLKIKGMEDAVRSFASVQIQDKVAVNMQKKIRPSVGITSVDIAKAMLTDVSQQSSVIMPGSDLFDEVNFREQELVRLQAVYDLFQSGNSQAALSLFGAHLIAISKYESDFSSGDCEDIYNSVKNMLSAASVVREVLEKIRSIDDQLDQK